MPIASLRMTKPLNTMMMRSSLSIEKDSIGRRHTRTDVVDDLSIAYDCECLIDEFTLKHGYKSIVVDDLPFYPDYNSVPSQDDDLLCNQSCFSDSCKSVAWSSLICPHISILHDFEKESIFSSDKDGAEGDEDSDGEAVLMDIELCIPFGIQLFHHHGDINP